MKLNLKDLHTPFNTLAIRKIIGKILGAYHEQAVAAAGTVTLTNGILEQDASHPALQFISNVARIFR